MRKSLVVCVLTVMAGAACAGRGGPVDRDKSENRLRLCEDMVRTDNLEAAEVECDKSLAFNKCNEGAHNMHGVIDLLRANRTAHILEIDECLTGVDAEGLRDELDDHLAAADLHFARAVECASDYGEAYQNRCVVAILMESYDVAVKHCSDALAHATRLDNVALTHANLGWALFHAQEYPRAAAELRKAVSFQPQMCLAEYRLGRVYFARKEWEKAVRQFEKAVLELNCPIQEGAYFLMLTYAELGLDASKMGDRCQQMAPNSCVAAKCRALVANAP